MRRRARDLSALFLAARQFSRDSQLASVLVSSLEVLKAGVPINEIMHYSPVVTAFSALHLFPAHD